MMCNPLHCTINCYIQFTSIGIAELQAMSNVSSLPMSVQEDGDVTNSDLPVLAGVCVRVCMCV